MASKTIEKLSLINTKAQEAKSNKMILLNSFDFVEVFDRNKSLEPINNLIISEYENDNKRLLESKKMTLESFSFDYDEIKKDCINCGIDLKKDFFEKSFFNIDPKGSTFVSGDVVDNKIDAIKKVLDFIVNLNFIHIPFVSKFACVVCYFSDKSSLHVTLKLPSKYNIYNKEKERLARIQNTKIWYLWDLIVWTYKIYKYGEELKRDALTDNFLLFNYYSDRLKAIKSIIDERTTETPFEKATGVSVEEFKYALQMIYLYIVEKLNCKSKLIRTKKNYLKFEVIGDNRILKLGKKECSFNINFEVGRYVNSFYPNPYNPIKENELVSKVTGEPISIDLCGKEESVVEERRKSANKKIKECLGIGGVFKMTPRKKDDDQEKKRKREHWINRKYLSPEKP